MTYALQAVDILPTTVASDGHWAKVSFDAVVADIFAATHDLSCAEDVRALTHAS
jgi:hypothetical protein